MRRMSGISVSGPGQPRADHGIGAIFHDLAAAEIQELLGRMGGVAVGKPTVVRRGGKPSLERRRSRGFTQWRMSRTCELGDCVSRAVLRAVVDRDDFQLAAPTAARSA
jgi:hypothetical protein